MSAPDSSPQVHGDERTPPTRPPNTWAEVEALAAILEPEAFDPDQLADEYWRTTTKNKALAHAARVLAAGYVHPEPDPPDNAWRIEVTIPLRLPVDMRHELFSTVVSAVEEWEPAPGDRDGWDADVSGHPVYDDLLSDDGGSVSGGGNATK